MRVGLVSLNQDWLDKDSNFIQCQNYIEKAAYEHCDIIIFPEMTLTGFSPRAKSIVENISTSRTFKDFGILSKKYNINIIFGACLEDDSSEKPFNMLCLADSYGQVKALYAKIHLFSHASEDKYMAPGDKVVTHNISGIEFGCSICYDLRFPELFSIMSSSCKVMIVIANWPKARKGHWCTLLKARAIENESVILGVNRVGSDGNGLNYEKSSMMVLPNGVIEKPIKSHSLLDIYNIDMDEVEKYRNSFPTVKDKMHNIYREFF